MSSNDFIGSPARPTVRNKIHTENIVSSPSSVEVGRRPKRPESTITEVLIVDSVSEDIANLNDFQQPELTSLDPLANGKCLFI